MNRSRRAAKAAESAQDGRGSLRRRAGRSLQEARYWKPNPLSPSSEKNCQSTAVLFFSASLCDIAPDMRGLRGFEPEQARREGGEEPRTGAAACKDSEERPGWARQPAEAGYRCKIIQSSLSMERKVPCQEWNHTCPVYPLMLSIPRIWSPFRIWAVKYP